MTIDSDDEIIVGGYFADEIQWGNLNPEPGLNDLNSFLAKFNQIGECQWILPGYSSKSHYYALTTDEDNNIYGGANMTEYLNIGDFSLTTLGSDDGVIVKASPEGIVEWVLPLGGEQSAGGEWLSGIEAIEGGEIIASAQLLSPTINGKYYPTGNSNDLFVLRLDTNGEILNTQKLGNNFGTEITYGLTVFDDEIINIGGYFFGLNTELSCGILNNYNVNPANPTSDAFIWKSSIGNQSIETNPAYDIEFENFDHLVITNNSVPTYDSVKWLVDGFDRNHYYNTQLFIPDSGNHEICMIAYLCPIIDTLCKTVEILGPEPPAIDFDFTWLGNGNIQFNDLSGNEPETWFWAFGDGSTSTDQNPFHDYNSIASFEVCLDASNENGAGETVCKTVDLNILGLHSEMDLVSSQLFPNPVKDQAQIFIQEGFKESISSLTFYSQAGKKSVFPYEINNGNILFFVENNPPGIYFYFIANDYKNHSGKFVVK